MNLTRFKNIKEPYILILVGPQLSGKSTFVEKYKQEVDPNVVVISTDDTMMQMYSKNENTYDETYKVANFKDIRRNVFDKMKTASENLQNVIIDTTNLTARRRQSSLHFFGKNYNKIAVVFKILEMDEYIKRNNKRTELENKHIPVKLIKEVLERYEPVSKKENFNQIINL